MDVYKEKFQSDGSLDKLKFRIVVRGYLKKRNELETLGQQQLTGVL